MVNENNLKPISANKKPFETVYELKDYKIKKSPLSRAARGKVVNKSGSNFSSEKDGYGPIDKWCYHCNANKDVASDFNYCPSCGNNFGTMVKSTSGIQKFKTSEVQRNYSDLKDRVERSGGEVNLHIGDRDMSITYRKNSN